MIKTTSKIKIPFNDLDPMNIVWHGNYVRYLEFARCEMFNKIGYTYLDMYKDGFMYPIAKMDLKFIKSATFNQEIEIECQLEEVEPAIIIKYKIYDSKTKEKLFHGSSMQICVSTKTKEAIHKAPSKLLKKIEEYKNA